jgi:hypothetical protein
MHVCMYEGWMEDCCSGRLTALCPVSPTTFTGAYGTVWLCSVQNSDQKVALKRFKEAHSDPEVRACEPSFNNAASHHDTTAAAAAVTPTAGTAALQCSHALSPRGSYSMWCAQHYCVSAAALHQLTASDNKRSCTLWAHVYLYVTIIAHMFANASHAHGCSSKHPKHASMILANVNH